MIKLPAIVLVLLFSPVQPTEIYVGKSFPWTVYYDPGKTEPVVEVGGIKFGFLDCLRNPTSSLHHEGEFYYYKSDSLNVNIKLKKQKYSNKIDGHRYKIFQINAFNEISRLKDSLKIANFEFDWEVKAEYEYYRDNLVIPRDYVPNYKKKLYEYLK